MKILLVNYEYTLTGSALILVSLAEHLRRSGHDVSVCAAVPATGPIKDMYQQGGFAVLDLPIAGKFDVAICSTVMTAPQLLALPPAMKIVWWLHEGSIGLEILLRFPAHVAAFGRANAIVFPIAHLRDDIYRSFTHGHEASRVAVIPYGIPAVQANATRREADDAFRVVSVGSVYPRKGHMDLIRAMALYRNPAAHCTIVGKFYSLPDDCLQLIEANPTKFELTGELDRAGTVQRLSNADVFCLPSYSEVMPLAILEAAMLERPLVLSDLRVYEGFWRHGRNALLYPVGDIGLLAQSIAMLAVSRELRIRLGAAARKTAAAYTEAAFYSRFDALLNGL